MLTKATEWKCRRERYVLQNIFCFIVRLCAHDGEFWRVRGFEVEISGPLKCLKSVSSVASRQHLRSASRGLFVVPHNRFSSYGRRAFSVADPAIWNWLPDSLRDPAISRDSFKRSLKTFLFSAYSCT